MSGQRCPRMRRGLSHGHGHGVANMVNAAARCVAGGRVGSVRGSADSFRVPVPTGFPEEQAGAVGLRDTDNSRAVDVRDRGITMDAQRAYWVTWCAVAGLPAGVSI